MTTTTEGSRRGCLRLLGGAAAAWLLSGHSPYRQWDVFRKARLVLLASASDPASVRLGEAMAAILAQRLPDSRATFARSRDTNDLVRLVASRQLELAVLREAEAHAVLTGAPPYADNGSVALRTLAQLGTHLFVCLEDLPNSAAYHLVDALAEGWGALDPSLVAGGPKPGPGLRVPLHAGAAEYYRDHP
jgi:TRAP-type uncharacterized transport system substrate-binding protein